MRPHFWSDAHTKTYFNYREWEQEKFKGFKKHEVKSNKKKPYEERKERRKKTIERAPICVF